LTNVDFLNRKALANGCWLVLCGGITMVLINKAKLVIALHFNHDIDLVIPLYVL